MKHKGNKNITYTQRLQLEKCLNAGLNKKEIAEKLGVHLATIYNELKRGAYERIKRVYKDWIGDKHIVKETAYSPELAEERYRTNMTAHGAQLKVGNDFDFVRYIEKRVLVDKLSPCAALGELNKNNMFRTKISKTTLYRYIEIGIFPHIRLQDLPTYNRRKRYRKVIAKRPPRGTSIEKRPPEVLARNTFGHWEMVSANRSAS